MPAVRPRVRRLKLKAGTAGALPAVYMLCVAIFESFHSYAQETGRNKRLPSQQCSTCPFSMARKLASCRCPAHLQSCWEALRACVYCHNHHAAILHFQGYQCTLPTETIWLPQGVSRAVMMLPRGDALTRRETSFVRIICLQPARTCTTTARPRPPEAARTSHSFTIENCRSVRLRG